MELANAPKRFTNHHNAFGFLRLVLASLVIVSHTPEIVDGNRKREILTQLFHTMSFGELAVDGFFVISGFLITASYHSNSHVLSYLLKRVTRIYPAFIVSSLICVFVIGPLGGGGFEHGFVRGLVATVGRIVVLCQPAIAHVFLGTGFEALNVSAWTIQYEFVCYLMIVILGAAGILSSYRKVACVAIACLLFSTFAPQWVGNHLDALPPRGLILMTPRLDLFRLGGMFLAGSAFHLAQSRIPITLAWATSAFVMLCIALFVRPIAELGFALFGSYLIFAIASAGSSTWIAMVNNRNDISYGLYLFAWPIENLLVWWHVSDSLVLLGALTWILSAVAGTLSWFLVEKPVMRWTRARRLAPGLAPAASPL